LRGWMGERRKQAISMELGTEPRMAKMKMKMKSVMSMASGRKIDWRSEHTHTDTQTQE
jgi:hypothetical protein